MNRPSNLPLPPRVQAYLELFRLPNVFTAMADIFLGFLLTHHALQPTGVFLALLAASSSLYLAGTVLNDYYDRLVDAAQRPHRPIPSGRISPLAARWLGFVLLLLGVAFAWLAGAWVEAPVSAIRGGVVASLLAITVWAYDGYLKQTPLGPPAMGTCRFLNVLLGMSAAAGPWQTMHWMVAAGVGVYIVGVTWFARTEAVTSSRPQLALATGVMAAGLVLLARFPMVGDKLAMDHVSFPHYALSDPDRWNLFWVVLAVLIGWRCVMAVIQPVPLRVQAAVKHCILSLIMLDAACCFAVRDMPYAVAILLLLVPTMFLSRWIYST